MTEKLKTNTLILIGMTGAGKTTIGKKISYLLKKDFFDSDSEIEKKLGFSINQIFEKFGEDYFREKEAITITRILNNYSNIVLSIGGGAFINKNVRELIHQKGCSIWLNANYETIHSRLKNTKNLRPIFKNKDFNKELKELLNYRKPFYNLSDIKVDVNNLSINEIVDKIIKKFEL